MSQHVFELSAMLDVFCFDMTTVQLSSLSPKYVESVSKTTVEKRSDSLCTKRCMALGNLGAAKQLCRPCDAL